MDTIQYLDLNGKLVRSTFEEYNARYAQLQSMSTPQAPLPGHGHPPPQGNVSLLAPPSTRASPRNIAPRPPQAASTDVAAHPTQTAPHNSPSPAVIPPPSRPSTPDPHPLNEHKATTLVRAIYARFPPHHSHPHPLRRLLRLIQQRHHQRSRVLHVPLPPPAHQQRHRPDPDAADADAEGVAGE
ncbi:uncharacterized protein LTR77_001010 [Saxophila tyrrhenica]|uniref:Uncharacterized protein n=1 Tax=Saxophila tyrrhenica TaxID=1690608 RepID=A0AAV9PSW9_9PEZI|nr:hypothetical protein LTR77_001010 [Saxophila tyrrhenica]